MTNNDSNSIRFSKMALEDGQLVETEVRTLTLDTIRGCPFVIFDMHHYREDGSCKCDDADEQRKMLREWGYTKRDFKRKGITLAYTL